MDHYTEQHMAGSEAISSIRKEEVLLTGLRFEHARLTHGHLLRGDPTPLCVHYGLPLAISHILLECEHYDKDRRTFHLQGAMRDILGDDRGKVSNVVAFLQSTGIAKLM
jgi:hypothetical protein